MNRKAIAKETLRIVEQGWYEINRQRVEIAEEQRRSAEKSVLIQPGQPLSTPGFGPGTPVVTVKNCSAVDAVLSLWQEGKTRMGVLNFASAKNPGGGFLNGAMAQEESLAASSGLYPIQCTHSEYYQENRACGTACYTDYAIYSPAVVFFRDGDFALLPKPVTASVLTLPAINFGQVLLKGEDAVQAKAVMKARMRRALAVFAHQGDRVVVLGAYGCGVFQNDPVEVAHWWQELMQEGFAGCFDQVFYAVFDRSRSQSCHNAFQRLEADTDAAK